MTIRFYLFLLLLINCNIGVTQSNDSLLTRKLSDFGLKKYQGHLSNSIDKEKQDAYVKQRINWLRDSIDISILESVEANIIDIPDLQKVSYKFKDCQKILLPINKQIIISVHSAHKDSEIGDVCIGMVEGDTFYINYGHVCGGLINFERLSLSLPTNVYDFFGAFVSDTDGKEWVKLDF